MKTYWLSGVRFSHEEIRLWVNRFSEPRIVITDKLRGYIKPEKTMTSDAAHRAHKGLNNAIEVSHRPTLKREKMFGRFKSHRRAQKFLSDHD